MNRLPSFGIIICFVTSVHCKFRGYPSTYRNNSILQYVQTSTTFNIHTLRRKFGGDLPTAVYDMVEGFPLNELAIAYDNHTGKKTLTSLIISKFHYFLTDYEVVELLTSKLRLQNISIYLYNLTTVEIQEAVRKCFRYASIFTQINSSTSGSCKAKLMTMKSVTRYSSVRTECTNMFFWRFSL